MTLLLRLLPAFLTRKSGLLAAVIAGFVAVAGFAWMQHSRLQAAHQDLSDTRDALEVERVARQAAQDAVADAVERAERLAAARNAAQARLTDRLAAVEAAQGVCLDAKLPEGLLD